MLNQVLTAEPSLLQQPLHFKVANYLNTQRRTGQYCDLILELENTDTSVFGHLCIVGAQSQLISDTHILQKTLNFSINNPLKVTIKNFTCVQCLHTIVDFFYEDVVSIAKDHEEHFKKLAKTIGVTELVRLFETQAMPIENDEQNVPAAVMGGPIDESVEIEKDNLNLVVDIFGEQRNYFELKNPKADSGSSKINHCIGCDFKCYRVQEMISHMSSCEASHLTCSLCEIGFLSWREQEAHLRKHSSDLKKPFFCLECEARFMTRAALLVHHPKHRTETPHRCEHCGKAFKWKHGLSSHLLIHSNEKQMLCDVCGYSTTHMKALKSHKLQHTGEFFKCTYPGCNHKTNRKENLKLHIETHKQERPFVCEVCGCKFSQSKNLKRHALKHSADDGKRWKCQLCPFSSHRSDKVKEHLQRVHTLKSMQLELPEVVDNAFENKAEDEFLLPVINRNDGDKSSEAPKKVTKRRCSKKTQAKTSAVNHLRPLLPKVGDA